MRGWGGRGININRLSIYSSFLFLPFLLDTCKICPPSSATPESCDATIVVAGPQVSDNCDVATVTNSYTGASDANGTYPLGDTVITWTVTDIHGNESSADQLITVNVDQSGNAESTTTGDQAGKLGKAIDGAVKRVIMEERRSGGLLHNGRR